jgi:hypothetical protein
LRTGPASAPARVPTIHRPAALIDLGAVAADADAFLLRRFDRVTRGTQRLQPIRVEERTDVAVVALDVIGLDCGRHPSLARTFRTQRLAPKLRRGQAAPMPTAVEMLKPIARHLSLEKDLHDLASLCADVSRDSHDNKTHHGPEARQKAADAFSFARSAPCSRRACGRDQRPAEGQRCAPSIAQRRQIEGRGAIDELPQPIDQRALLLDRRLAAGARSIAAAASGGASASHRVGVGI